MPSEIRKAARTSYRQWKKDPWDSDLEFKEINIGKNKSLWSVRVTEDYRALGGFTRSDVIEWGWIGTHNEYNKLISAKRARKGGIAK